MSLKEAMTLIVHLFEWLAAQTGYADHVKTVVFDDGVRVDSDGNVDWVDDPHVVVQAGPYSFSWAGAGTQSSSDFEVAVLTEDGLLDDEEIGLRGSEPIWLADHENRQWLLKYLHRY